MAALPIKIFQHLKQEGWAALSPDISSQLEDRALSIAQGLGAVVMRRPLKPIDSLSPIRQESAKKASLSHSFGLGSLPLHSDTAHWTVPTRYIVLACAAAGSVRSPTTLLDANDPTFSEAERLLLRSSTFIIKNGRQSFYGSIVDANGRFTRFDPGCMLPATKSSVAAMQLYGMERQRDRVITHHWAEGDVLIIDNWRMLHGRGNDTVADPLRRLIRVYAQ